MESRIQNPCVCKVMLSSCEMLCRSNDKFTAMQMKEEQLRLEESEADMRKRLKSQREHHKEWEENRESRVGTWRDFAKGNKSKKVRLPAQQVLLYSPCKGHHGPT